MRDPAFWWRPADFTAGLLAPLAAVYGLVAARRMARPGYRVGIPVVCVGNPTLGGAGKTPTAIAVAQMLNAAGRKPFVLSRGYGGSLKGPVQIDLSRHRSPDVGDEPLVLARAAPTIVSRDRVAGAEAAKALGADVIVMDDGFQNPALMKDRSILVVDGRRGIGNGKVFPSGPLRAPLSSQLRHAQALLVVGPGTAGETVAAAAQMHQVPVFHGRLEPDPQALDAIRGHPVLAFAGIGDPAKFFATLREAGIDVRAEAPFADHHRYRRAEAQSLLKRADREGLIPVTTEKDWARLAWQDDLMALAAVARTVPVKLVVAGERTFREFVVG